MFFITLHRVRPEIKFIIGGDFAQLLPVNDRIENLGYANSPALHELSDGNNLNLTTCRRSDNEVYNMCLPENINELRKSDSTHDKTKYNLCYTNVIRKKINKEKMDQAVELNRTVGRQTVVHLKAFKFDENSQDVALLPNTPIIARMTSDEFNIMNNECFTITSNDNESIATMDSPTDMFVKLFNVAYCITTHKAQGCSFNHPCTIHEWERMDNRLKYVCLSRSTKREYINMI